MGDQASKAHFEWYEEVAKKHLQELKEKENLDTFKDCKTREAFSDYMLNVFIGYYGLRCSCDDCMDWKFSHAGGHYHHCPLYRFTYLVNRCLDWAEQHHKKEVKAGCNADSHDDGIPPNNKLLGILPTIL